MHVLRTYDEVDVTAADVLVATIPCDDYYSCCIWLENTSTVALTDVKVLAGPVASKATYDISAGSISTTLSAGGIGYKNLTGVYGVIKVTCASAGASKVVPYLVAKQ